MSIPSNVPNPAPHVEGMRRVNALGDVHKEVLRIEELWGIQSHENFMWNAILAEEVGEAAQECLTEAWGEEGKGHGDLREEVVQVAAVAVAWIMAIDRKAGTP